MPTKLIQLGPDKHESGTAALQVQGAVVDVLGEPELCEIAIVQLGASERYLDPRDPDEPWKTAVYYLWPRQPRREGAALWFEIDHGVTYHLRANTPYKLRIRSLGGAEAEEVFTLPASTRRPSTRPEGWTPPPDPRGPVQAPQNPPQNPPAPAPSSSTPAAPAAPAPEPEAAVPPAPTPPPPAPPPPLPLGDTAKGDADPAKPGGKGKALAVAGVVALLLAGGAAFVLFGSGGPSPAAMTMDSCRQAVSAGMEPAAAREKAEGLAKASQLLDCQFLLFKHAAEKGDAVSARQLGLFYDPDTWTKEGSPMPAPNPLEAARWHKQAADAGDAESLYRYGMLLKLGRTDDTDGPEKAQAYLQKALDAGHPLAKDALAK